MAKSEKELAFIKDYKNLIEKHNVKLVLKTHFDEFGQHTAVAFLENGDNCGINFFPESEYRNLGYYGICSK